MGIIPIGNTSTISDLSIQSSLDQLGKRCPECGSRKLVEDKEDAEVICSECGLVIENIMFDRRPEWRAFTLEEMKNKNRSGPKFTYTHYDKGLSTTFDTSKDSSGHRLPSKTRHKMRRLKFWDKRIKKSSTSDRNLTKAMLELDRLADKLNISNNLKEETALLYRKALKKNLIRGRSITGIMAAATYAVCRLNQTPRSLKEIVKASPNHRKEISRDYRLLLRNFDLKIPIDDPQKYVSKIAYNAGLDQKVQNKAIKIIKKAKKTKYSTGKEPAGLAGAALYMASKSEKKKITQKELSQAADVTEVTLRNRYKDLIDIISS
jgi:transcription initiation factor TFIIB